MPQRVADSKSERSLDRSATAGLVGDARARQLRPDRTVDRRSTHLDLARAESSEIAAPGDRWLRTLDIIGSVCGLILLMPAMLFAAVVIKLGSSGPILYRQERIGRWGEPFVLLKFRTMDQSADEDLAEMLVDPDIRDQWSQTRKIADDPRITRVGRILRAADLDELPQLWNVLKGEMSLVGPRPVPAEEAELYGTALGKVLSVLPGLTGLWQVNGRNNVTYERRISLDLSYVEERSVQLNLRLIAKTLIQLVGRRGQSPA